MKTLDVELLDGDSKEFLGKVQVFEIPQLTPNNPIKGYFPAFDSNQIKIADVYISIQFESHLKNSIDVKKSSDHSEVSRPVTPTPMANMNEFYTKYEQFEKKQLELNKNIPQKSKKQENPTIFNSNSYVNTLNEDIIDNSKNPIIQNLIERGLKLKQEMSKSTLNTDISFNNKTIDLPHKYSETNAIFSLSKNDFLEDLIDDNLNEVSRLSDPLHDPLILSTLIYDRESLTKNYANLSIEDQELKNLLEPPDLLNRFLSKNDQFANKNHNFIQRSASKSSISSNDQTDDESIYRNPRVSFEIQSSDAESSICNDRCIDILSPQKISLLNLIQISRISIDKLQFFHGGSILNILERFNKVRDASPSHQLGTKSTNSKSKPPLASKKNDLGQLFFIEYQFPVMGNMMEESTSPMSSQIMRVVSKKFNKKDNTDEFSIIFDHNADYSVLFNSHSLESWWRSYVSFKIYARPPLNASNTKAVVSSNSLTGPQLIGLARLSLRNVLKSRNFKLLKRLAVNDSHGKRIGTLNVSLELTSDLEEFIINLKKLKSNDINKQKNAETPKKMKKSIEFKQEKPVLTIQPYEPKVQEEFSIPIQMYLSINEGRGFNSDLNEQENVYLISRLFWNKEKIKFDASKSFNWTLNLSFMIKKSIIENMKNNFMIIEAWKKGSKDTLIGTIKLPLHEFYLKTNDLLGLRDYLKDGTKLPLIGIDGWLSVFDLFTGQKVGEINLLMALGSQEQILNIQKIVYDKNKLIKIPYKQLIEHVFMFKIDDLKIHPVRSNRNEIVLDECEYYAKYSFPSTPLDSESTSTAVFNNHTLSTRLNQIFKNKIEHKIFLPTDHSIQNELTKLFQKSGCLIFEIWSKNSHPNLRERLIGRGELSLEKFLAVINNSNLEFNNRSFIIPLICLEEEKSVRFIDYKNDRYIGQLFLTIEYRRGKIVNSDQVIPRQINNSNDIQMSIGILRANGLKSFFHNASKNGLPTLDNSNVYVKFSLSFLNKPFDFKQTRFISSSLSGYSPEFFDYFDINCPLVSKYDSNSRRTISLAEQIELGQIVFEIWCKYSENYKNSSDILLGTCSVCLEPMLENRIGIRGWMPIKPVGQSSEIDGGNLEIAIRFIKNDDFLKIIENGKKIGWIKSSDFQIRETQIQKPIEEIKTKELSLINYQPVVVQNKNLETNQNNGFKKKIKCLIEIEKAIHLPKVYDEKQGRNFEPDAFVMFSLNIDNLSETSQTKICEQNCSPIWNYQLLFYIDSEYFIDESKYFILKVFHKNPEQSGLNKLLGCVSVDLQPLMCGLTHLSGWYNIQDPVGNSQGQLKVNILPQENLFEIKEAYLKRKKSRSIDNNKVNSFYRSKIESDSQISLNSPTPTVQSTYSLDTYRSKSVMSSDKESSIQEILKDKNELKIGLLEKLSELDQLNKMLKERLEKKNLQEPMTKVDRFENTIEIKKTEEPIVREEIKILAQEDNQKGEINEANVQVEAEIVQNNELEEIIKIDSQPIKNLLDSFWAESLESDGKSEKSIQYEIINSIDSDKIDHLPPIFPNDENLDLQKSSESNIPPNDHLYDTDLDQTCNLNASYEMISSRQQNSESPQIETYDVVDKIIDCNKLESDDEKNHDDDNKDNNKSLLINDNLIKNYDSDWNEDDENLTVIVPAELNKITDKVEENVRFEDELEEKNEEIGQKNEKEDDSSQKTENLSAKFPNYFLPKEDLEKNMKKLHYNYVNITQNQESEDENDQSDQDVKTKLKSTTLLIQNKNLLKQDLSRINKIFHTKFN